MVFEGVKRYIRKVSGKCEGALDKSWRLVVTKD